nr:hypothetical protein [Desulfovibrio sp.]
QRVGLVAYPRFTPPQENFMSEKKKREPQCRSHCGSQSSQAPTWKAYNFLLKTNNPRIVWALPPWLWGEKANFSCRLRQKGMALPQERLAMDKKEKGRNRSSAPILDASFAVRHRH